MYTVTRKSFNFFNLAVFIIPDINLPPSPICLSLRYAVCFVEIKSGRLFLSFSERAFDIIFKEMGLQFCMNILSLSFFLLT